MKQAPQTETRNLTRLANETVRAGHEKRSRYKPVIVDGIGKGSLITVTPSMFKLLDVDPSYQRGKTTMVNEIIRVLQAGGKVFDPVTLCERRGSDKLWIVDGYQRVCAFQEMHLPFEAMVHKSDSAECEHDFFIALNSRKAVHANVVVKAWNGPSGALLRKVNEAIEHPLYERLNFSQGSNVSRIGASIIARSLLILCGSERSGHIRVLLSSIDVSMSKAIVRARIEHFLRLIGRMCEKGALPDIVMRALAMTAVERWEDDVQMPKNKVIERLKAKNWSAEFPLNTKYLPVIVNAIKKIWK